MAKEKKKEQKKISKKMTFAEIMEKHPEAGEMLMQKGMHCMGCPMAMQETLEQGSMAHGLDPENIEKELNAKLQEKK
tara:strand:+ start:306 stop:536 length:231 start_codon:yes stop_codon:yes gene_type:complete